MKKQYLLLICMLMGMYVFCQQKSGDTIVEREGLKNKIPSFQKSYTKKVNQKHSLKTYQQSVLKGGASSYRLMQFSRGLGALLAIYEATDSLHYISEALDLTEAVISKARKGKEIQNNPKVFKDDYLGWANINSNYKTHKSGGKHLQEVPLFESYLFRYLAKLSYLIICEENNMSDEIKTRGERIFKFVKKNGWDKWYHRGQLKEKGCYPYLFRSRTHMTSHWGIVAQYLKVMTDSPSKKVGYDKFISLFDQQLKANLELTKRNAYTWNMTWDTPWPYGTKCKTPAKKPIIQDVSHGNHVISYIITAYELLDENWTKNDIQAFSNTVKYVIYDSKKNRFNGNLNGKFIPKVANGIQMADGFVKLARYDKDLFNLFEKVRKVQYGKYKSSLYEPQYVAELKLAENIFITDKK